MDEAHSYDDIDVLLNDTFRDIAQDEGAYEGPNEDAQIFYNLVDEASQELYPGCKGFSKLSFTIRLYLLNCLHGWSNASFTSLLQLLKEAIPELNIPESYNKAKAVVRDLGLDYKKIDACPNDCMLFRGDYKDDEYCHVCGASRFVEHPEVDSELDSSKKPHRVPIKILRHFSLIPRLKRLFMSSKTAESLRWHDEQRSKNGKLRHPADGQAWKEFDNMHQEFAKDSEHELEDPYDDDKHYVMKIVPRDLFSMSDEAESDVPQSYINEPYDHSMCPSIPEDNSEVDLVRSDIPATVIKVYPREFVAEEPEHESEDEDEFDIEDTS
ncbi:hypothetical protein MTR67_012627 [Solanum verrucosum]|uniref:Transposase-associated domain-containing protein n=1 Tax=Solanum verrucosum TaxID=315347 RepID=A0AAF0Q923_SOLVR|nr:hypothetical protein MTR67_012627 [Solanum verrucosum]